MLASAVVICALAAPATTAGAAPIFAGVADRDAALDAPAERAAVALGQALEKRGALDLGSPPLPDTGDAGPDAILSGLAQQAKARYQEGDFAAAVDKANEAISRFEGGGAYRVGGSWAAYADALVLKALALRRQGKEADADAALAALASTMPSVVPDSTITPPKVAQRHQQILDELRGKPRVSIEIASAPAGADVVVDGVASGKAPVVVRDLLPGTHFVGMSFEGARVEKKLVVAPGATGRVDEKIGDPRALAAKALRTALVTPLPLEAVAEKAREVGDDVVVGVLTADADGPLLVLARVRGGATAVAGVRLDKKAQTRGKTDALVDAVLDGKTSWIGKGPAASPAAVMSTGVAGAAAGSAIADGDHGRGDGAGDGEEGGSGDTLTIVVASVGAGVLVAAVAGGVIGFLVNDHLSKQITVTADASTLHDP